MSLTLKGPIRVRMMCLDVELRISEALKDPHPSQVVVDEKKKIKQKPTLLICGELL